MIPRFISLLLYDFIRTSLAPRLRAFVCSHLFFKRHCIFSGHDRQRTLHPVVCAGVYYLCVKEEGRGRGAGGSGTIGLEEKRSEKWERWGKRSWSHSGFPRNLAMRSGKGRGINVKDFTVAAAGVLTIANASVRFVFRWCHHSSVLLLLFGLDVCRCWCPANHCYLRRWRNRRYSCYCYLS